MGTRLENNFLLIIPAAMVDEALGAPFRQGGAASTGLYNSIFSGMQASTRAELAGGSKDQATTIDVSTYDCRRYKARRYYKIKEWISCRCNKAN